MASTSKSIKPVVFCVRAYSMEILFNGTLMSETSRTNTPSLDTMYIQQQQWCRITHAICIRNPQNGTYQVLRCAWYSVNSSCTHPPLMFSLSPEGLPCPNGSDGAAAHACSAENEKGMAKATPRILQKTVTFYSCFVVRKIIPTVAHIARLLTCYARRRF